MAPSADNHARSSAAFASIKSSAKRLTSTISPVKESRLYSLTDTEYQPSFSTDRSSTSSRSSNRTAYRTRSRKAASASTASLPYFQEPGTPVSPPKYSGASPISVPKRKPVPSPQSFVDVPLQRAVTASAALTNAGGKHNMASSGTMTMAPFAPAFRSGSDPSKPPSTAHSTASFGQASASTVPLPTPSLPSAPGAYNPTTVFQHIQDMASKRISTLDYLRKSHEGRMYWYNTLLFSKPDLAKLPYFEPKRLARRATNYLLLGLSLPTILDMNASSAMDYLRALNALLAEFESYQQVHPPEGSSASSLSRARIPAMFKRATHAAGAKGRRASSAQDIGLPMGSSDPADLKNMVNGGATSTSSASSFPVSEQELLPGEEYTHLLTPSLPFDPDYFETFATLCDVLIDCYTRIMSLVPSPSQCAPGISEIFAKADAKLRKIIVSGIVKEFEEASRNGAKTEIAGVGKVVLGGLM